MKTNTTSLSLILFSFVAPALATQYVYRDSFESGYESWSWATVNCSYTASVYNGSKACQIYFPGPWTGFFAGHPKTTTTRGYDAFCMAIKAENVPVPADQIVLKFKDDRQIDIGNGTSLWPYVKPDNQTHERNIVTTWRNVCVPLYAIEAMDRTIGGLMIMSASGNNLIVIDDLKLTHTGLATPGTFYADGVGRNVIDESWTFTHNPFWNSQNSQLSAHQGDLAFRAYFNNQWEGIMLRKTVGVHTAEFPYLHFWIKSRDASRIRDLRVEIRDIYGSPIGSVDLTENYIQDLPDTEWIPVTIPVVDFGGGPSPVVGAFVLLSTRIGVNEIFLDDISLTEQALRMPLLGGRSWAVTTSPGDIGCTASSPPEPSHTDGNFFSIDFSPRYQEQGFEGQDNDPVVFAIYDGQVIENKTNDYNGNYLVIKHDGNPALYSRGFQSRYLHLRNPSPFGKGSRVRAREAIGVMGNTGDSTAVHLHLGFRYQYSAGKWSGGKHIAALERLRLEGLPLLSYLTECSPGSTKATRYYPSSQW